MSETRPEHNLSKLSNTFEWKEWIAVHLQWNNIFRLGAISFQFGLCILIIHAFSIESRVFLKLAVFTWFGFIAHHLLPMPLRLPFFGLLSLAAVFLVFGVVNGGWIIGIGGVLIGIAHLPVHFHIRVGMLLFVAVILALQRDNLIEGPIPGVIWPILGAMFMFRMIVYMYDMRTRAAPFSFWHALAYFFMIPNVIFPLFPVIDYKTFTRHYYDHDPFEIYQVGVKWLLRGLIQLILYRIVYQNFLLDPITIDSAGDTIQFIVSTYLLYLKISGTFHIIVGLMHLFGFNLPETHHNYLLSNSFTDFWRRINIYWKDFILKIFFNPVYFRLSRKMNTVGAMTITTFFAFFVTWMLHSYQWFWIRGSFPITWQDAVFWTFLATIVLANMIWETKNGRRRNLKQRPRNIWDDLSLGVRTIVTFIVISTSWTLWTAESWTELTGLMSNLTNITFSEIKILLFLCLGFAAAAIIMARSQMEQIKIGRANSNQVTSAATFWRSTAAMVLVSCGLLVVNRYPLTLSFSPQLMAIVEKADEPNRLNAKDARALERGYYEDLTDLTRFNTELASLYRERPVDWSDIDAIKQVEGFPPFELMANQETIYKGALVTTNQWALRDREYSLEKPSGTFRIAILGASHTFGSGVTNDETYENVVEDKLNLLNVQGDIQNYEILNFGVGGYGPLDRLVVLNTKVAKFDVDMVIMVGIDDHVWLMNELIYSVDQKVPLPYAFMDEVVETAQLEPGLSRTIADIRLSPHTGRLLETAYRGYQEFADANDIPLLFLTIPRPEVLDAAVLERVQGMKDHVQEVGMLTADISDAYDSVADLESLWIARWDRHPNKSAHELLAEKLYQVLIPLLP